MMEYFRLELSKAGRVTQCFCWCYMSYRSDTFRIQNGMKQGDALTPQLFNSDLQQRWENFVLDHF